MTVKSDILLAKSLLNDLPVYMGWKKKCAGTKSGKLQLAANGVVGFLF
jgi:hypothetical protein